MTIISHKYKFIFLKPQKVASTSVQQSLAKFCGDNDIISSLRHHPEEINYGRNNMVSTKCSSCNTVNTGVFYPHMPVNIVLNNLRKGYGDLDALNIWTNYTKITIIRNPWDAAVSSYCWNSGKKTFIHPDQIRKFKHSFYKTIRSFCGTNIPYYFYTTRESADFAGRKLGSNVADFYIRFEHIQDDVDFIYKKLGMPTTELSKMKVNNKRASLAYQEFYDEELKNMVYEKDRESIDRFGYTFDGDIPALFIGSDRISIKEIAIKKLAEENRWDEATCRNLIERAMYQ